jgi:hypothetical protein
MIAPADRLLAMLLVLPVMSAQHGSTKAQDAALERAEVEFVVHPATSACAACC